MYHRTPKRKTKKSKSDLKAHFERRWHERVDQSNPSPFDSLNYLIQHQPSDYLKVLGSISNDRSAYLIAWKGRSYKVIYNKKLNSVVTVYPFDASTVTSTEPMEVAS